MKAGNSTCEASLLKLWVHFLEVMCRHLQKKPGLVTIHLNTWVSVENHLAKFRNALSFCIFALFEICQLAHIPQNKQL